MNFLKKIFKRKDEVKLEQPIQMQNNLDMGCSCDECERKKNGDYQKNITVNIETIPCAPNPYFRATKQSVKFFEEYELRMTTLHRMYKINNIFLKEYQKSSRESLTSTKNDDEAFVKYSKCYFINNNAFKEIHYMSNLLNVFIIFEVLLKYITKDLAYDKNIELETVQNKNSSYLNGYIYFIESMLSKTFTLKDDERNFIGIVRKIRNDYLHGYMTEIPESMEREIVKIFGLRKGKRIVVDEEFIQNTCFVFGNIAKRLEKSYLSYKHQFLKT